MSIPARICRILIAVVATALAARVDVPIPGSPVPQSLQTFAVVLAAVWLGSRDGAVALLLYLLVGLLGAPVFADGAAGVAVLTGPTGGYLIGFVLAAALGGAIAARRHRERIWQPVVLLAGVAAHVLILAAGWAGLARQIGAAAAWQHGVAPFVVGGLVKSLAAALVVGVADLLGHNLRRR